MDLIIDQMEEICGTFSHFGQFVKVRLANFESMMNEQTMQEKSFGNLTRKYIDEFKSMLKKKDLKELKKKIAECV